MTLKVLDLFAGIGGFSLGLHRAGGFETVGFVEIDPFCQRVLAKHWPDVPCHDDITTREFRKGEADVITGGWPCQDVSYAGAGAGLAGERSGLYREVVRAIRVVRPLYAVLENVAALLGRGLGTVLGDMAEIGYDAEWHCIPASAVGAPHRRDRIWIVANPGGEQHESHRAPLSGPLAAELSRTNTDADRQRPQGRDGGELQECSGEWTARTSSPPVGDTVCKRELQPQGSEPDEWGWSGNTGWWLAEPDVGRVAHGVPSRVDRLRSLGNSVVPQIPEIIARSILSTIHSQGEAK